MSTLHVFNPWHDEALAAATPYYTPTAAARQVATSLASLPKLWARTGDVVLPPQGNLVERLGDDGAWHEEQLDAHLWHGIHHIEPWGWDACLVLQLRRRGASTRLLPSEEALAEIRRLSSRHTAVELLPRIRADVGSLAVGRSAWCTTLVEVETAISEFDGTAYVKTPWSCSGRGVFVVETPLSPTALARIAAIIRKQGAVEVEPAYDRVQDFAMEFTVRRADKRKFDDYNRARGDNDFAAVEQDNYPVHYEGLSIFSTSAAGDYGSNIIDSEEGLLARLPAELHPALAVVRTSLQRHLAALLLGRYVGPVGVDMMVVRRHGPCSCSSQSNSPSFLPHNSCPSDTLSLALHPCVEVNLRRTMGHVAIAKYKSTQYA